MNKVTFTASILDQSRQRLENLNRIKSEIEKQIEIEAGNIAYLSEVLKNETDLELKTLAKAGII